MKQSQVITRHLRAAASEAAVCAIIFILSALAAWRVVTDYPVGGWVLVLVAMTALWRGVAVAVDAACLARLLSDARQAETRRETRP